MDNFDQQFIDLLMRSRNVSNGKKERKSKAAALTEGTSKENKAQLIQNFIFGKY